MMNAETLELVNALQNLPMELGMGFVKAWGMLAVIAVIGYFGIDKI